MVQATRLAAACDAGGAMASGQVRAPPPPHGWVHKLRPMRPELAMGYDAMGGPIRHRRARLRRNPCRIGWVHTRRPVGCVNAGQCIGGLRVSRRALGQVRAVTTSTPQRSAPTPRCRCQLPIPATAHQAVRAPQPSERFKYRSPASGSSAAAQRAVLVPQPSKRF